MSSSNGRDAHEEHNSDQPEGVGRRSFLFGSSAATTGALLGGALGGAGLGGGIVHAVNTSGTSADDLAHAEYPFYGEHQQGIITPAQEHMHFAAFDVRDGVTREEIIDLLKEWTYAASRLTMGLEVSAGGAFNGDPYSPPADTGEAYDHPVNGLSITFGFGKSFFEKPGDPFGVNDKKPAAFTDLPKMVNDFIDPQVSHGDICIQACANDPQVAVHAIRNLTRLAFGKAQIRWAQLGFGRASSTTKDQPTPRILFGQKDGTANLKAEQPELLDEHVWIQDGWAKGGTYLCARKIYMTIEVWDGLRLEEQDRVLGRHKGTGAPLSGGEEFTPMDFDAEEHGEKLVDEASHVFRAHPDNNDGIRMLRRAYNYVDGTDDTGRLAAGLFFIAFVNDPERFARVHKNLARDDMLIEYLKTLATGVYLIPPGVEEGDFIGSGMFT